MKVHLVSPSTRTCDMLAQIRVDDVHTAQMSPEETKGRKTGENGAPNASNAYRQSTGETQADPSASERSGTSGYSAQQTFVHLPQSTGRVYAAYLAKVML